MGTSDLLEIDPGKLADPTVERLWTPATVVTFVRTVAAVALSAWAAYESSELLLVIGLAVYWVGDMLDGFVARLLDCETRIGGTMDILCDRMCAAAFYVGLAWLEPELSPAIFVYLFNFMVIDHFLSLTYLAWPIRSPNYFYLVDHRIWWWNWSKPAKAINSAFFAVLLLVTGWMWVALAIAVALVALKVWSMALLFKVGLPLPTAPLPSTAPAA